MIKKKLIKNANKIDQFLIKYLKNQKKSLLVKPMKYGVISGGKKIRSTIIFDTGKLFKISEKNTEFTKSIFTLCDYRKNDKCPPWSIQASKMFHDSQKKTIYYDNAIIKVFDLPVFYLPRLSHPDPSVKRRSGFLVPSISDSKNLGYGVSIPYFFDVGR